MIWTLTKEQEQRRRRIGRSPMRKPRAIHSHASHCRRCLLTGRCLVQTKPRDLSLAWLGWDWCLVLVTLSSNPGLSGHPASHWQAPQHRESRGRSSPPLLPPLLQPSRPRSASRSPPPEDHLDHWVRIRQAPASSPRWTTNHRWSTAGWTGCRWGRGSCTWSKSRYSLVQQPWHAPNDCLLQFPLWRVVGTDVESLTVSFWISIIALDLQSKSLVIPANFLNLVELSLTICISGWIMIVLYFVTLASQVRVVSGGKAKIG